MNDQKRNGTPPLPPAPPQSTLPSGSGRGALPQYIPNNVRAEKREKLRQDQSGDITSIPRLIKRDLPHHQSTAKVSIVRKNLVNKLALHDWFHMLLRWTTTFSISILLLVWTFAIIVFALIYMYDDKINPLVECGLGAAGDPIGFNGAFAFSLETCTTVGYGLPNSTNGFFEQSCTSLQAIIYFQMVWSMMFNAFLFSFFFSRLSRSQERSVQVLFSNKAIIERKNGKWVIHIRVYDLDSSLSLVEAHARMYCVSWNEYAKQKSEDLQPQLLQTMRILHPNDELDSSLFPSIPSTITHHIDAYSPLTPSYFRKEANVLHGHGLVYVYI
uniref:Potassium channel inwardly rectifying transmembrane domain-containing protein n=1 Tax=Proboscia inermis TaxID=420281 RepID=A0A7S0CFI0_9STRA|mmetsp:Transcript_42068/g.42659  ORF Transcript_42068/g.42659 Transcript_42068/m.42659 type:complete len:328 (+) Transcript_42068:201-1184(+)